MSDSHLKMNGQWKLIDSSLTQSTGSWRCSKCESSSAAKKMMRKKKQQQKTEKSQKHSHEFGLRLVGFFLKNSQKQNASEYKTKVFRAHLSLDTELRF